MLCPCGSKSLLTECCQLYIAGHKLPVSAEALMRSRFSAYASNNAQYLYDTYAKSSQVNQSVADIQQWAEECKWLALEIHHAIESVVESSVEFSAYYLNDDTLCTLREKSRFIKEGEAWRYLDGEISQNEVIAKIKRNENCPCNRYETSNTVKKNKKYKQCCAR
jgi:SEC-C motif-containing protein